MIKATRISFILFPLPLGLINCGRLPLVVFAHIPLDSSPSLWLGTGAVVQLACPATEREGQGERERRRVDMPTSRWDGASLYSSFSLRFSQIPRRPVTPRAHLSLFTTTVVLSLFCPGQQNKPNSTSVCV